MERKKLYLFFMTAVLASTTLFLYLQTMKFEMIGLDDTTFIRDGGLLKNGLSWASFIEAFTTFDFWAIWMPVTYLAYMTNISLFGMNPCAMHFVNASLHAINACLVFWFLFLFLETANKSKTAFNRIYLAAFMAAAFWAWHPLRVENVAWISSLKDLLYVFFGLLAVINWVRSLSKSLNAGIADDQPNAWIYIWTGLAMMSKSAAMTIPLILMCIEFLIKQRVSWSRYFPLLGMSVFCGGVAVYSHELGSGRLELASIPFYDNVLNALTSVGWYIGKTVWPSKLYVPYLRTYPYLPDYFLWSMLISVFVGLAVCWLSIRSGFFKFVINDFSTLRVRGIKKIDGEENRTRVTNSDARVIFIGLAWFIIAVAPTLGIVSFAYQSHADRFLYLSSIGVAIIMAWVFIRLPSLTYPFVVCLVFLISASWQQIGYWKNNETLFTRSWQVSGGTNRVAAHMLALNSFSRYHDVQSTIVWFERYYGKKQILVDRVLYIVALLEAGEKERARLAMEAFKRAFEELIGEDLSMSAESPLVEIMALKDNDKGIWQRKVKAAMDGDLRVCYAVCSLIDGDTEQAYEHISLETARIPECYVRNYVAGRVAEKMGRAEDAAEYYRKTNFIFLQERISPVILKKHKLKRPEQGI
jgi:protein O-mannosyl-transferase